jgi:hypothetical protein
MTIGRDAFSKAGTITVAAIEQGVPLLVDTGRRSSRSSGDKVAMTPIMSELNQSCNFQPIT